MRFFRLFFVFGLVVGLTSITVGSMAQGQDYSGNEDPNKKIIKQGLLGAGVGAISAEASGGKAGAGALVGAGTNVIGGALLDTLMGGSSQSSGNNQYAQATPAPTYVQQQPTYTQQSSYPVQTQGTSYRVPDQQPVYVQQQPVYAPPQQNANQRIIKQGLLGAGVGAISASASGGKAGKGALIGAGTNIIGGALLDTLMGGASQQQQAPPQPIYYQQAPAPTYSNQSYSQNSVQPKKKIIRKYDNDGNVVSEEEVWE